MYIMPIFSRHMIEKRTRLSQLERAHRKLDKRGIVDPTFLQVRAAPEGSRINFLGPVFAKERRLENCRRLA